MRYISVKQLFFNTKVVLVQDKPNIISYIVTALVVVSSVCVIASEKPTSGVMFDVSKGVAEAVFMPNGKVVNYTAYTKLYYVTNVEDSTYQYMNVFVPDGADLLTPIFMPNYVSGSMVVQTMLQGI